MACYGLGFHEYEGSHRNTKEKRKTQRQKNTIFSVKPYKLLVDKINDDLDKILEKNYKKP